MKKLEEVKGITLIALVITIIVLLILAGVSIATLTGENGILNKASKAKEEHLIEQYKEEINLIIIDEIAERKIKSKTEALIVSLENKIKEKEWVEGTKKCNEEGIEQQPVEENNRLLVNTKDGYEIIIEVDNIGLVAKIIEVNKVGEKGDEEQEEEKTTLEMAITNNKITEGANISIDATSTRKLEKIEVKVQDTVLYSQNNIGTTSYHQSIGIEQLSNLGQLAFYDDITLSLEATTITGMKETQSIEKVKNYTVSTAMQLNQLASVVNGGNSLQNETVVQLADIDVNPGKWTENANGTTIFQAGATEWQVIGSGTYDYDSNSHSNIKAFEGSYDGKQHKIEGIYINNKERDSVGLFSNNYGMIKNIVLKNSTIKGRYLVGGIVAGNFGSGTIENCENYANVLGTCCVGGICGWSQGILNMNKNYGQISNAIETGWRLEREAIGGIAGWGENTITKCENYGKIMSVTEEGDKNAIGGIVGCSDENGNVNECKNSGNVTAKGIDAGGIIGMVNNYQGTNFMISKCYNTGDITGRVTGGINSWGNYIQIQDCYNTGIVAGNLYTGGIVGWTGSDSTSNGFVTNCYNIGKVSGTPTNLVGGILGKYNEIPTLTNCYNLNSSSAYAVGDDGGAWGDIENQWVGHVETKTEGEMKGLASVLGSNWTDDTNNVNNGYPVLK